jgi:hypothetical protein
MLNFEMGENLKKKKKKKKLKKNKLKSITKLKEN